LAHLNFISSRYTLAALVIFSQQDDGDGLQGHHCYLYRHISFGSDRDGGGGTDDGGQQHHYVGHDIGYCERWWQQIRIILSPASSPNLYPRRLFCL